MNFLATIVIPLKIQKDQWLHQCVQSAAAQTVPCEVIVVRSQSTPPANVALLRTLQAQWSNIRVLLEERPGSFPAAINQGIRSAAASRVGLLLSDDWLEADAVEHCLPETADVVSTGLRTYLEDGLTLHPGASSLVTMSEYKTQKSMEARANYLQHFFLFRKEALLRAGGLDESIGNFPGIDDYDLIWTLLENDADVAIVERYLYNYRDHSRERLTLADPVQAVTNLKKILRKHRVPESEMAQVLKSHSRWYGRTIHEVMAETEREEKTQLPGL